jgi:hypothetical protein
MAPIGAFWSPLRSSGTMTLSEATRQYQIAKEHYMSGKRELEGVLSMEEELETWKAELKAAEQAMITAWCEHVGR